MYSEFTDRKTITDRMQSMPSVSEIRAGNRLILNKIVGKPLNNLMVITRDLRNSQYLSELTCHSVVLKGGKIKQTLRWALNIPKVRMRSQCGEY